MSFYIGLISGTSMDGVDAALVDIRNKDLKLIEFITCPYSQTLSAQLHDAIQSDYRCTLHEFATLDANVGREFASATHELLRKANAEPNSIEAIGSHGQTVRHSPDTDPPYSLQIGSGSIIAHNTGITTVCDFRSADIAAGGQGAPLVPAFHEWMFRTETQNRVIVNIGGISNITVLPADPTLPIQGFDTGPGNCLMDEWCRKHLGQPFDQNGEWAASGTVCQPLLDLLLDDPFLKKPPPKSTGRESYNAEYLDLALKRLEGINVSKEDVQATLLAYTVRSISLGIKQIGIIPNALLLCGGGAQNHTLMEKLSEKMTGSSVASTSAEGMHGDAIESVAFAWLAHRRANHMATKLPSNLSKKALLLGCLYEPA